MFPAARSNSCTDIYRWTGPASRPRTCACGTPSVRSVFRRQCAFVATKPHSSGRAGPRGRGAMRGLGAIPCARAVALPRGFAAAAAAPARRRAPLAAANAGAKAGGGKKVRHWRSGSAGQGQGDPAKALKELESAPARHWPRGVGRRRGTSGARLRTTWLPTTQVLSTWRAPRLPPPACRLGR